MRQGASQRPFTAERQRMRTAGEPDAETTFGNTGVVSEIRSLQDTVKELADQVEALRSQGVVLAEGATAPTQKASNSAPVELDDEEERKAAEVRMLKIELNALAHSIETTKKEIAMLMSQSDEGDRLTTVTSELDAVVEATEHATDNILEAVEKIGGLTEQIQAQEQDSFVRQLADEIQENTLAIFESCNFQDLTGQRINKVVNTLKFVEDRVDRMMEIWGKDTFDDLPEPEDLAHSSEDERLLNGPQDQQKGISQDEIDRLFD